MPVLPKASEDSLREAAGEYDGAADMVASLNACYAAIRSRVKEGGPGWLFPGLPRRHYRAIVADPPWKFKSYTAIQSANPESRRDVERHYPTMGLEDICALPVRDLAAPDCHLFLWATGPCLPWAFKVMQSWGFKYSTVAFTWMKLKRAVVDPRLFLGEADLHVGLGLTTRKNAEFVLLGRRGNARRSHKDVREAILSPVREHSRKPDEMYDRVRRYCDGPYLELFARRERMGWDVWGDEVHKRGVEP